MAAVELSRKKRLLLAEKTGRGKSFAGILAKVSLDEDRKEQDPEAKPMKGLIICPKKMVSTWEARLCGPEYDKNGQRCCYYKQNKKPNIAILSSDNIRSRAFEEIEKAQWVVVNYEMLSGKMLHELMKHHFEYLITRVRRFGQKNEVDVDILLARGCIEEVILKRALVKQRLIDEVLDGKLLSDEEWEEISHDFKVTERSYLNAYIRSDAKRLKWLIDRMKSKGPEEIREFFTREEGEFGRLFAELYENAFETSYHGDNFGFLIDTLLPCLEEEGIINGDNYVDLGSGPLLLARALSNKRVFSIDLNPFQIEFGRNKAEKEGIKIEEDAVQIGSFDQINIPSRTQDVAICSLAFDFTSNFRKMNQNLAQVNRVKTLLEFNRILRNDGTLIILLSPHKFVEEQLENFVEEMKNFGFEYIPLETGHAKSVDNESGKTDFKNIVITLRKKGEPSIEKINIENLEFSKREILVDDKRKKGKIKIDVAGQQRSLYGHKDFVIEPLKYEISDEENHEEADEEESENEDLDSAPKEDSKRSLEAAMEKIQGKIEKALHKGTTNDLVELKKYLREHIGCRIRSLKPHEKNHIGLGNNNRHIVIKDGMIYFQAQSKVYEVNPLAIQK